MFLFFVVHIALNLCLPGKVFPQHFKNLNSFIYDNSNIRGDDNNTGTRAHNQVIAFLKT